MCHYTQRVYAITGIFLCTILIRSLPGWPDTVNATHLVYYAGFYQELLTSESTTTTAGHREAAITMAGCRSSKPHLLKKKGWSVSF